MITPGGIVQRIAREPSLHLEYVAVPGEKPAWSTDRAEAFFFQNHADAKKLAKDLGGAPIVAVPVDRLPDVEEQPSTLFPDVVDLPPCHRKIRVRTLHLTGTQA